MRLFVLLVSLLFAVSATAEEPKKLRIVTSFSILEDMAQQLGGDFVEVHSLIGRGVDAHHFEPKPADAKLLKHADLVIVNGFGFDDWAVKLAETSGYEGNVLIATKGIKPLRIRSASQHQHKDGEPHAHNAIDPHAWHSLSNAEIYARNITTALAATDPKHADVYGQRLTGYLARIKELKTRVDGRINRVPLPKRFIVVPHNTFSYFAGEYRFTILSPQGTSTAHEASAADVGSLINEMRRNNVRVVFTENIHEPILMEQVADETGAAIGGVLYTDSLSDAGGEAGTYLEMIRVNVDRIAIALNLPITQPKP